MGSGWDNSTFVRVIVIAGVPYSGVFIYSPTLGHNNLVGSWTSESGTDPYGNAYPAGFSIFDGSGNLIGNWSPNGLTIQAQPNSGGEISISSVGVTGASPGIHLDSGNQPVNSFPALIQAVNGLITAGADTLFVQGPQSPALTDPHESYTYTAYTQGTGDYGALMQLVWWEIGAGPHNYVQLSSAGAALVGSVTGTVPGSLPAAPETWHPISGLGYQNGWTDFGGTHQTGRYQRDATGRVWLDGDLAPGTYVDNTLLFTMPAGYRPAAMRSNTRQTALNGGGTFSIEVATNGQISLNNIVSTAGPIVDLSGISWPTV